MPGYKETVQILTKMKMFFGLIAQFGLVFGQVNPEDFNDIAQVRFFEERKWKLIIWVNGPCTLKKFQIYLSRFVSISTLKKVSKKIQSVPTILQTVQKPSFIGENLTETWLSLNHHFLAVVQRESHQTSSQMKPR